MSERSKELEEILKKLEKLPLKKWHCSKNSRRRCGPYKAKHLFETYTTNLGKIKIELEYIYGPCDDINNKVYYHSKNLLYTLTITYQRRKSNFSQLIRNASSIEPPFNKIYKEDHYEVKSDKLCDLYRKVYDYILNKLNKKEEKEGKRKEKNKKKKDDIFFKDLKKGIKEI